MIDVRNFDGDDGELAAFINRVWQKNYGGRIALPVWTETYFSWQFTPRNDGRKVRVFAAYEGSRLLGVCPVELCPARLFERKVSVSLSSWLTASPGTSRLGVGRRLAETMLDWAQAEDCVASIGYVNGAGLRGKGALFWSRQTPEARYYDRPRLWVRPISGRPKDAGGKTCTVRPFRPEDIESCLALLETRSQAVDLAFAWNRAWLQSQLSYADLSRTVVAEAGGKLQGFVNFHLLSWFGQEGCVAMIDHLVVVEGASDVAADLVSTCLRSAHENGGSLAMILGEPVAPEAILRATGFRPAISSYRPMLVPLGGSQLLSGVSSMHIPFR